MSSTQIVVGTRVRVVEGAFAGHRGTVIDTRATEAFRDDFMLACKCTGGTFFVFNSQVVVDDTPEAPVQKPAVDTTGFEAIMEMVFPDGKGALFDAP